MREIETRKTPYLDTFHAVQTSKNFFKKIATEIYKVKLGISPIIMNEIFRFSKNYVWSLGSGIQFEKFSINTVQFGNESTVYLGAKIWELTPKSIKSSESVDIFKCKI